MNPLTKTKLINKVNEREVQLGVVDKVSWQSEYKDSAWIFLGGGHCLCVLTIWEIVNINLMRDKKTGKSKGFCFLCYKGQRSTILATDNFNGIKMKGRTIRVDHVSNYRTPKDSEEMDDVTKKAVGRTPSPSLSESSENEKPTKKHKNDKKKKKKKKEKEKTDQEVQAESKTVKEKDDPGSEKHSSKNSETAQKSEPREGPKLSKARTAYSGGAEDLERDLEKEKPKHEHKSSSRREAREEKTRNRDRGGFKC
uniref:RRM domain-containing protein n=1 Tax=Cercocebus atys TaxID=9531 RepID=A0A2K5M1E6_CERAT